MASHVAVCIGFFQAHVRYISNIYLYTMRNELILGKLGMQAEKIRLPDNSNQAAYLRVAKMV